MGKLKLGPLLDDKPVKLTIDLPASVHRDLCAYADALGKETGTPVSDATRLIAPMLERFMSSDRGFSASARKR
jgi:hypothetical protein